MDRVVGRDWDLLYCLECILWTTRHYSAVTHTTITPSQYTIYTAACSEHGIQEYPRVYKSEQTCNTWVGMPSCVVYFRAS